MSRPPGSESDVSTETEAAYYQRAAEIYARKAREDGGGPLIQKVNQINAFIYADKARELMGMEKAGAA